MSRDEPARLDGVETVTGTRPKQIRISRLDRLWDAATVEEQREMLRLAIERIVLVPRPKGNPRGKGQPRGRRVKIEWADWLPDANGCATERHPQTHPPRTALLAKVFEPRSHGTTEGK